MAAVFAAVFFLSSQFFLIAKDLLLLNSGRDYIYIVSLKDYSVKAKISVCKKEASCTDIIPLESGYIEVLHRIDFNQDARKLYVYDKSFKNLLKTIKVDKSPYIAFPLKDGKFLINHTFFSFNSSSFSAEIIDGNSLKVVKVLNLDGIPSNVIRYRGIDYAVIEDVRGVINGVKLKDIFENRDLILNNPFISSNIDAVNDVLYCAVNDYGYPDYKNSLLKLNVVPLALKNNVEIEVLKKFKTPFPYILGHANNWLVIGFTNHSLKNNFNKLTLFNVKNGKTKNFKICFGPESMVFYENKIYIACISEESFAVVDLKTLKLRIVKLSDTVPGFSRVKIVN
ncbi:hypothetical protein [Thermotomaculum hydrothermale]|nr:hypothetical protein [Thermotomaculum hydrothermale]